MAPGGKLAEISKRDIWSPQRVAQERPDVLCQLVAIDFLPTQVRLHTPAAVHCNDIADCHSLFAVRCNAGAQVPSCCSGKLQLWRCACGRFAAAQRINTVQNAVSSYTCNRSNTGTCIVMDMSHAQRDG